MREEDGRDKGQGWADEVMRLAWFFLHRYLGQIFQLFIPPNPESPWKKLWGVFFWKNTQISGVKYLWLLIVADRSPTHRSANFVGVIPWYRVWVLYIFWALLYKSADANNFWHQPLRKSGITMNSSIRFASQMVLYKILIFNHFQWQIWTSSIASNNMILYKKAYTPKAELLIYTVLILPPPPQYC